MIDDNNRRTGGYWERTLCAVPGLYVIDALRLGGLPWQRAGNAPRDRYYTRRTYV